MQVTMMATMCGPSGNAFPGDVLNLDEKEAKKLLEPEPAKILDYDDKGTAKNTFMTHRPFAKKTGRGDKVQLVEERPAHAVESLVGREVRQKRR